MSTLLALTKDNWANFQSPLFMVSGLGWCPHCIPRDLSTTTLCENKQNSGYSRKHGQMQLNSMFEDIQYCKLLLRINNWFHIIQNYFPWGWVTSKCWEDCLANIRPNFQSLILKKKIRNRKNGQGEVKREEKKEKQREGKLLKKSPTLKLTEEGPFPQVYSWASTILNLPLQLKTSSGSL